MPENVPVIEMKHVWMRYRKTGRPAIQDVSLKIFSGEKVGLIGGNGSGKTTLLHLLMNFVLPEQGSIQVMGKQHLEKARRFIGFIPERQGGMENFTPRELMTKSARMFGLRAAERERRIQELLEFADLDAVADILLSDFSKGMLQRVQICIALIHQPPILLLDEPMSGLDPLCQKEVRALLERLGDKTILYTSHQLEEIEAFCSSVLLLREGKMIRKLDLQECQEQLYVLECEGELAPVLTYLKELDSDIDNIGHRKTSLRLKVRSEEIQALIARLKEEGITVTRLHSRGALEGVYHHYLSAE